MSAAKNTGPEPAEHENLASALAAFQADLPAVHKGAQGQVPGKRDHRYADLADLSAVVLPALGKVGLSWMTMPTLDDQGRFVLRYELLHTSGQNRTGDYILHGNNAWEIGSSLTYARRYCLSAVTGVAADDDDDGAAANQAGQVPNQGRRERSAGNGQQARNGAQKQQPEPEQEDTPQAARSTLSTLCKARNLAIADVDAEYQRRSNGKSLGDETSPAAIRAFIDGLNNGSVTVPAGEPAGASS